MKRKVIVISLGGSLIIPNNVDLKFLEKFKKTLRKHYKTHKFIVVCGGGSIARRYMALLKSHKKNIREIALGGIRATRMNAELVAQLFDNDSNKDVPISMSSIKNMLKKRDVVFCGALRFNDKETSDGTAAKLANYFNTIFINLTNISGLFTSNPQTNKTAKFIPRISWKDFEKRANKIKYKPGQHFILDQNASTVIRENKIPTYIIGKDLSNFTKILLGKKFKGTLIEG